MHPAPAFRAPDDAAAAALVRAVGFATIVAMTPGGLLAGHTPLLLSDDATSVRFHLSRANALTAHLDAAAILAVVRGPDGYISPHWTGVDANVPTWNYGAVEMSGHARRLDREQTVAFLDALSAVHEARVDAQPAWTRAKLSDAAFAGLLRGIVAFVMPVESWRSTFKFSQNKSAQVRERIVRRLDRGADGAALADAMRAWDAGRLAQEVTA